MNTANKVDALIADLKARGVPLSEAAWQTALACVGWPYVFGAWGAYCTVAERKKRYREAHPTIATACQAFDGGSCSGCKWYPEEQRVRCFDCRGFTDWVLKQFGFDLQGEGATSQWKNDANWSRKGLVKDGIPQGVLVCLFYPEKTNKRKMAHTGFYFNGETCECSNGVQHFTALKTKWTHWALPKCIDIQGIGEGVYHEPDPAPTVNDGEPVLRRGDKGPTVKEAQQLLMAAGYALPKYGADGDFGAETQKAVKDFQWNNNIIMDGIIGPDTWAMLKDQQNREKAVYTVTIPHLDRTAAEQLIYTYRENGAKMAQEGGD